MIVFHEMNCYPKDKLSRLYDVYLSWCKLKDIVVSEHNYRAFVLGQPLSYWE